VPDYFKWLSYLSWFRYGNEALTINQWAGVTDIICTRSNTTCPANGKIILETLNFNQVRNKLRQSGDITIDDTTRNLFSFSGPLLVGYRLPRRFDCGVPNSRIHLSRFTRPQQGIDSPKHIAQETHQFNHSTLCVSTQSTLFRCSKFLFHFPVK
jgi:hypothetical protein